MGFDLLTAGLVLVGGAFMLLAGVGVVRLPDLFTRMQAATKGATLGAGCLLLAVAAHFRTTDVAARAVEAMRSLTGFDRVMVYRFDREWNGEVIAEARTPTLNSFLGLHYPATDIPAQARELYRRNWLRLIPDIAYRPVPIHPRSSFADDQPLDLSLATLRSVSPIHVEYLSNMGVSASMSVSILVDGNLWGLIACHHYSGPHRPSVAQRNAAEHLGQLISLRVAETAEADTRRRVMELTALADGAADAFVSLSLHSVEEALQAAETDILKLAGASAAVVLLGGRSVTLGRMPDVPLGELLAPHWNDDGTFVTEWALRCSPGATPRSFVRGTVYLPHRPRRLV